MAFALTALRAGFASLSGAGWSVLPATVDGLWVATLSSCRGAGTEAGVFAVADADYTANVLWTQTLGIMHLTRIRVGIRQAAPGVPALFSVTPEQVVETCVEANLATVGVAR